MTVLFKAWGICRTQGRCTAAWHRGPVSINQRGRVVYAVRGGGVSGFAASGRGARDRWPESALTGSSGGMKAIKMAARITLACQGCAGWLSTWVMKLA